MKKIKAKDMCFLTSADLKHIRDRFDIRWGQLHSHLHSAAYLLNPRFMDDATAMSDAELMAGFHKTVEKLVPAEEAAAVVEQLTMFRDAQGAWSNLNIRYGHKTPTHPHNTL